MRLARMLRLERLVKIVSQCCFFLFQVKVIEMMSGSSLRLTMVNFHCIAKQTRAFASPLMRYVSPANIQTPANSRFLLRNVRALHTSITRNTDSGQENTTKSHEENGKKLALKDRLKFVVAEYGTTAIVFHVSISLTSLGLCYTAVKRSVYKVS